MTTDPQRPLQVVTTVVNNPQFIVIQHDTLKRYMKTPYEFIVFNDAKAFADYSNGGDVSVKPAIERTCEALGVRCLTIPNEGHRVDQDAARRCSDAMNYVLDYQRSNPGRYLGLDSDMFLVADLDASARYGNRMAAVVLQCRFRRHIQYIERTVSRYVSERVSNLFDALLQRVLDKTYYIWNGIYYLDTTQIKDQHLLDWSPCSGCDVGGMMHHWLSQQIEPNCLSSIGDFCSVSPSVGDTNLYVMDALNSGRWRTQDIPPAMRKNNKLVAFLQHDERNTSGFFFCEVFDGLFLHYRSGGNWRGEGVGFHQRMAQRLGAALRPSEAE